MASRNSVVTFATFGIVFVLYSNVAFAYPPTYSDEPTAVNGSGGIHVIPQLNFHYAQQHNNEQLTQEQLQKYPDQHPNSKKFTTSKTSSTSTSASPGASSFSLRTTSSSDTISATSAKPYLHAAFVYKAEVPTHIEPEASKVVNAIKLASEISSPAATSAKISSNIGNTNSNSKVKSEKDDDLSKKIIGSSVVTSVSVILNGDEPEFTDALGQKVPKPQQSLQVASPINLLNPDRYEFYTFDEHGELVKRLMTMEEIQSIVANGDGEGPTIIHHGPVEDRDPEKNVQDIVNSVQSVLNKEVESNKNTSADNLPVFDTPDVSSSWSMILPAIFGNAGSVDIFPQQKPQQIVMTPDTEIIETSTKKSISTTTKKPKPSKRKPGQKRKPTTTTTELTPQVIQEELDSQESVYTGMQQYQNLAATMQNYEGFSQLHMQPIYHKLPDIETSTRRIFINNQEVVKKPVIENDKDNLNEKESESEQLKPLPPHRVKKPNASQTTTKRPSINKQKNKKKTSTTTTPTLTTTTTVSTTTPASTTPTTPVPPPTTTTTTTTAPNISTPTTTISEPTTTSTLAPMSTTQNVPSTTKAPKKKKKKPTRHPVDSFNTNSSRPTQKPHFTGEKRKPSPKPQRPTQQHTKYPHTTTASDLAAEGSAHQEILHNKFQHVSYHRPRPKPNKPSSTTSTTTTTTKQPSTTTVFSPIPTINTNSPTDASLIVQDFSGYQPEVTNYGASLSTSRITTSKPEVPTSASIPSASGTSGYPVPSYGISTVQSDNYGFNQFNKQSLSPLALTQHGSNSYEQDAHTLQSFDQILQTLKQPEQMAETIAVVSENPNLGPVKFDSVEKENPHDEIGKKPLISVQHETNVRPSTGITSVTLLTDFENTSDLSNVEETTFADKITTPHIIIVARPQHYEKTNISEGVTTNLPTEKETNKNIETTVLPSYTSFTDALKESTILTEIADTTNISPKNQSLPTTEYPEEYETPSYVSSSHITEQSTFAYDEDDTTNEYKMTEDYTEHIQIEARLPVSTPHKVDSSINNESDGNQLILVADLKPQLNMKVIKPSEQITMSDFQTQAATVASTLVDGSNTVAIDYSIMSSNETKDEIALLMSDVIQQISNNNDMSKTQQTNSYDNRYSNQAQLDVSFLMNPSKGGTQKPTHFSENIKQNSNSHQNNKPIYERFDNNETVNNFSEDMHEDFSTTLVPEATTLSGTQTNDFGNEFVETTTFQAEIEIKKNKDSATFEHLMTTTSSSNYDSIEDGIATTETQNQYEYNTTEIIDYETKMSKEKNQQSSTEKLSKNDSDDHTPIFVSQEDDDTNSHNQNEEITTLNVPISPFSPIYAQQQLLADEREPLFEADSSIDTTTLLSVFSEESTLTENLSANESVIESSERNTIPESNISKGNLKEDIQVPTEVFIETIEEEKSKLNESESAAIKYAATESLEDISHTEQKKDAIESTTLLNDEHLTTEYFDLEPVIINDSTFSDADPQSITTDRVLENSTLNFKIQEDNADFSNTTTETTKKTEDADNTTLKVEQSNETEEPTTVVYQMSEETSAELNSMISEEDETIESIDEDPYIKLGETTTQKPTLSMEAETQTIFNNKPTEKNAAFEQTQENLMLPPPKPIRTIIENYVPTGTQPSMSLTNYSQTYEEADEEDEEDQMGYHVPKLPISTPSTTSTTSTTSRPNVATTRRLNTLKPVSYFNKQPAYALYQEPVEPLYNKQAAQSLNTHQNENSPPKVATYSIPPSQQRPMHRPPQLSNLMISSTQATRPPVKLEPSPSNSKGLEASLVNLDDDILAFAKLCNELAFSYWKSITSEKISSARSLVMSPFALTSMLSMVFLGARGSTSGEMNDVLKLDDVVTFNPHLVFKNITESVEKAVDNDIATTAFVREIFSDRANGKVLQFFKEKTQQLYAGHVEEVNFHVVNDIIRRRTNLLVKRHTMGKVLEYLRTNSVWVNGPLATISANLFQTDCSHGSTQDRDGEIFFQVHPTIRQRRLVPIPAVLFKSGFTAGYEPNLDATVVAFGRIQDTTSMIYVMPGHLSSISPSDNLDRLEKQLVATAVSKGAWSNLLTALMDRPGLEVQLPRFSHRSFVNATLGLQKMGLKGLFKSDYADLAGLTGSSNRDIFLSDMIQINTFSTCGEEKIADHHHVEMYPAPPLRKRNKDVDARDDDDQDSSEAIIDFGSIVQDSVLGRGFYDDLLDPKYLELPLPLRPRQARVPDAPRLRFDKPFLYFVRHNPTGVILFMGRFNPRLLP